MHTYLLLPERYSAGEFNDGEKIGEWKFYYPNGIIQAVEHYENNILNGAVFSYDFEGHLQSKENWKEGKNVLGIPNAGFVIRDAAGDYALEKNGQSLQQRNILPQKLIIKALNKELRFEPAKDLYVENPEPPKVEEVKEKEIKLEEKKAEVREENIASENRVFVIRSYHDE